MLTLCLQGGDGAGSFTANWIIDLHTKTVRRVMAYSEQDTGLSTQWIKLTRIENPKIEVTKAEDGQQAADGKTPKAPQSPH